MERRSDLTFGEMLGGLTARPGWTWDEPAVGPTGHENGPESGRSGSDEAPSEHPCCGKAREVEADSALTPAPVADLAP